MSRESRLVLSLLAIAIVGVAGLTSIAHQYRKTLVSRPVRPGAAAAVSDSARWVDGFLAARSAVKSVASKVRGGVDGMRSDPEAMSSYRIERFNAFTARGMSYDDYAAVRAAWRAFRDGRFTGDPGLAAAFQARRGELDEAWLGPLEEVDDSVR
jgi:hypothetical protein